MSLALPHDKKCLKYQEMESFQHFLFKTVHLVLITMMWQLIYEFYDPLDGKFESITLEFSAEYCKRRFFSTKILSRLRVEC